VPDGHCGIKRPGRGKKKRDRKKGEKGGGDFCVWVVKAKI
jgi:hypothetical protein